MSRSVISTPSSRAGGALHRTAEPPSAVPPPPGPDLLHRIVALRDGGPRFRPAPGVAAPRLEQVPSGQGYLVVPTELHNHERSPGALLRPAVSLFLTDDGIGGAVKRVVGPSLGQRDKGQLVQLASAALRDIAGLSDSAVGEWYGGPQDSAQTADDQRLRQLMNGPSPHSDDTTSRRGRRRAAKGRKLWADLAAWPWWPLRDDGVWSSGQLPDRWWEIDRVVETFEVWLADAA